MKPFDRLPRKRTPRNALILTAVAAAASATGAALLARKAERDNPPVGEFMTVNGVELHDVERGSGRVAVPIHGNAVMLQDFIASGLIDRLLRRTVSSHSTGRASSTASIRATGSGPRSPRRGCCSVR